MHDGETIDLCAPFGAFPGAPGRKNHLIGTVDNNGDAINAGSVTKVDGTGGGVEPEQLDVIEFSGGGNDNHIADNVDGFLDDFLALVDDSGSGGEGMDDLMDTAGDSNGSGNGGIAEEDLCWLEDMDLAAFLPPPAAPDAGLAGAGANNPLPSSAHEIAPAPEAAVVEDGAAAATAVGGGDCDGAAGATQAELAGVVNNSAFDAGASPSPTGLSAAGPAAVGVAPPALAGSGGGAGRTGHNDGGAAAHDGGGGGGGGGDVDAAGVSRKEQLRRQKVARYLAKKKTRQWSKAKVSSYQSRQRVANSRPRHKGRFLPLESDFVPIAELQRRQRALMKQMQEKAAAAKAAATAAEAPSFDPNEGGASSPATATNTPGAAAASGNVSPLPLEIGSQVAI